MHDGGVRIVVSGGTGVMGRPAVRALSAAGHRVSVTARSDREAALVADLGAEPVTADLLRPDTLAPALEGAEAVINLASDVPDGLAATLPRAWHHNDELWTTGAANLVAAADAAGVSRFVQESASFLYADAGEDWITEDSPLEITAATEPAAVAETHAQGFARAARAGVVLRFGYVVGDSPSTRRLLRAVARGRPIGIGDPEAWTHVVHTDDVGEAVVAALRAPSGVYNVGATPVRRRELVDAHARAAGARKGEFVGPLLRRLSGPRQEPYRRSHRVSSERFILASGWQPQRPKVDEGWFWAAAMLQSAP